MTLADAIAAFLHHCRYDKNLSTKTLRAYDVDLRQLASYAGKLTNEFPSLAALDKSKLRDYIQSLFGRNADKTIKRKVATIKVFFHFLEREDFIATNPFPKMNVRIREARRLPRTVPLADLRCLFRFLYTQKRSVRKSDARAHHRILRDIALLELLFATGARVSEICTLKTQDVDLRDGSVRLLGKGAKERIIQLCDDEVMAALRAHRDLHPGDGEYFFPGRRGHVSDQCVRAMLKQAAARAGVRLRLTPHMIRHSVATLLLEKGVDIRYIQHLLGHSSISTTQIYTSVEASQQRRLLSAHHPRRRLLQMATS